ncbi:MAG TPA: macro domain-containing protein [Armatimonadetes bacterium]|nr:macro domain-containing protein [Armatimonadota bacterium]
MGEGVKAKWGNLEVEIVEGDITEQAVDAIVNAANNELWMGGGVAGAIKRKGGEEIEREAISKGPIEVGSAIETGAGRLKAKYVIHAAVMSGRELKTDGEKIRRATRSALELAERLGVRSLAFPALGTGVGGFPFSECARIMLSEVKDFGERAERVKLVRLVLYGKEAFEAFREVFEGMG